MKIPDLSAPDGTLVDIIVRARNGHELTRACLDSIFANTPRERFHLILVDDGSEPPLEEPRVDWIVRSRVPSGAVTATNLGLSVALSRQDAAYVLVLDNDTRIPQGDTGWLGRMVAELEQGGPKTACVGATTGFANPPQHILTAPQTYATDWQDGQRRGLKANPPVVWFVSFAALFRKSVLREIGPWDEQYNPGNWEDTDYAVQLRTSGYEIRVARSVYIHHEGHQTFREDLRRLLQENRSKFHQKWGIGRLFDLGIVNREQLRQALS